MTTERWEEALVFASWEWKFYAAGVLVAPPKEDPPAVPEGPND